MNPYIGRFAPSPTGALHFGSLVAAAASYLEARKRKGLWLVRIEDVDTARTVPGAGDSILRELERLGLFWDKRVVWQSERTELYAAVLETLRQNAQTFPCACSRREVGGKPYPGTCRVQIPRGKTPRTIRMRAQGAIAFHDEIQGRVEQEVGREVGDFVLLRGDGVHAYHLAVTVDDHAQQVTQIVRGVDLLLSTPPQLLLYHSMNWPPPSYAHVTSPTCIRIAISVFTPAEAVWRWRVLTWAAPRNQLRQTACLVPVAVDKCNRKLSKQHGNAVPTASLSPPFLISSALSFLGHPPPPDIASAPPIVLWSWAVENWQMSRVPKVESQAVDVENEH